MRKTLKLLKLLAVITLCLSFYSCTDSSSYYESTSVTRTGGESGSTAKKPTAVYSAPSSKLKITDGRHGSNGFIFIVEIPPNPGVEDKFKGDWDTRTLYMVVAVPYSSGHSYTMPFTQTYGDYESAKSAYDAGKAQK